MVGITIKDLVIQSRPVQNHGPTLKLTALESQQTLLT